MLIKLKEEHLSWVLEGTRFEIKTIEFYRNIYVKEMSRKEACKIACFTPQFAQKKIERFENLFKEKCRDENIKVSVVLHNQELNNVINALDYIVQRNTYNLSDKLE